MYHIYMIESATEFIKLRTSQNPDEYNRASSEEADEKTWLEIIKNHPEMCFWIAQNKTIPSEIIKVLAIHTDPKVRSMIARKGSLKQLPEITELLSKDEDDAVRLAIAKNQSTPESILKQMKDDSWNEVRSEIEKKLSKR